VCRYRRKSMASKIKKSNVEENPFLPPLVGLDRIPLAYKDYLISKTKYEFDFSRATIVVQIHLHQSQR
jgi:hypothetical protein